MTFDRLIEGLHLALACNEKARADEPLEFAIEWFKANENDVREFLDDST